MTVKAIIEELTFIRYKHWNTAECSNRRVPEMGLSIINWPNLFLLNDRTVRVLDEVCRECSGHVSRYSLAL
jgi:hypothetical protein